MITRRGCAAIATMPLLIGALSGAASNPTTTFHGVFDGFEVRAGTCALADLAPSFAGVWNVKIPDLAGEVGYVTFNSRSLVLHPGNTHLLTWEHMASQVQSASEDSFVLYADSAMWGLPQPDRTLRFALADGQFTYHYEDHSGSGCIIDFFGHETT